MKNDLGVSLPVLVDEMDNRVWYTYGPLPNCAYLIDTDGEVLARETWFNRDNPGYMDTVIRSVTPIPSAVLLFGTGLASLLAFNWRKMN
jgi:hypothetical protein